MYLRMQVVIGAVAVIGVSGVAQGIATAPIAQVKALHEERCLRCHGTGIYNRRFRKVRTPAELEAQVARCGAGPAVRWSRDEIEAVASYLRKDFYRF